MKTNIINNIKAIVMGIIIVLGVQYVSAAWNAPTAAAPGNNVPAPINVGSDSQTKSGTLTVNDFVSNNSITTDDLTVTPVSGSPTSGQVLTADGTTGKVKWGNASGIPSTWRVGAPGCNGIITTSNTCVTQAADGCTGSGCTSQYYLCDGSSYNNARYKCTTVPMNSACLATNSCNWGQTTY